MTWPSIRLCITGPRSTIHHFAADYGPGDRGASEPGQLALEVRFGPANPPERPVARWQGRRKTTTWEVRFGPAAADPLQLAIAVRGAFGLPLLQSLVVEPALSLALPRHGSVLLPAAGIVLPGSTLIVLGAPRAGKSTLAVRQLVRGRRLLGDDHVIVGASGGYRPFPRRLRLYPEVRETSPAAYRQLAGGRRRALLTRRAVRTLTRGAINLPVLVATRELERATPDVTPPTPPTPARVAILQRSRDVQAASVERLPSERLVARALELLTADRGHLPASDPGWQREASRTADRERELLTAAWAGITGEQVTLPWSWAAPRGLAYAEDALDLAR